MFRFSAPIRLIIPALALFVLGPAAPAPRAADEPAVEVLLSSDTDIYAKGLNGIQATIKSRLNINYLDTLTQDDARLNRYFKDLEARGTPLVISIGPRAARVALKHLKQTPVLFSMVSSPRTLGPGVDRGCGVSMDVPIEQFFVTLKEISPAARRVYAFYSTDQGEFIAGEGEYSDLRHGLYYTKVKVNERADLPEELKKIKGSVDAIYIIADPLYDRIRFRQLSEYCKNNGIILMTGFTSLVKAGATFAITPDYSRIGELTGGMANRILSGKSTCAREGVAYAERTSFYLNTDYASASGVKIPERITERARLTRLMNAGIRFYKKNKLKSAKIIFDVILKEAPDNQVALNYRQLIVDRLTGRQTGELMSAAENFLKEGEFVQAMTTYQRVLEINPKHPSARAGYDRAVAAKSESEREQGVAAAQSGDYVNSILKLQQSLRTQPSNAQAARDLARVRRSQYDRIPSLLNQGINEYNRRNYAGAISNLNNVLLIQPGHRQAQEYLRLSHKKKRAMDRLLRQRQNRKGG